MKLVEALVVIDDCDIVVSDESGNTIEWDGI